jgi:hypothetical protein
MEAIATFALDQKHDVSDPVEIHSLFDSLP